MPISTRLAAILTTAVAVITYVLGQQVLALPSWGTVLATAVVTGITAYETAENT